jgi:hypothetical protein
VPSEFQHENERPFHLIMITISHNLR